MPAAKRVKKRSRVPQVVGVITSSAEVRAAERLRRPPDLFELRLDWLLHEKGLERSIRSLRAPIIITARHSAEGGRHRLADPARSGLLLRFLPLAKYVDVELRSVSGLRAVLEKARRIGVGTIISLHDVDITPTLGSLRAKAAAAVRLRPALFKVATRTDSVAQLSRLMEFFCLASKDMPVAAMGIGQFGAVSRLLFARCGSALIYTSLLSPRVDGQLSLQQFRAMTDASPFSLQR